MLHSPSFTTFTALPEIEAWQGELVLRVNHRANVDDDEKHDAELNDQVPYSKSMPRAHKRAHGSKVEIGFFENVRLEAVIAALCSVLCVLGIFAEAEWDGIVQLRVRRTCDARRHSIRYFAAGQHGSVRNEHAENTTLHNSHEPR